MIHYPHYVILDAIPGLSYVSLWNTPLWCGCLQHVYCAPSGPLSALVDQTLELEPLGYFDLNPLDLEPYPETSFDASPEVLESLPLNDENLEWVITHLVSPKWAHALNHRRSICWWECQDYIQGAIDALIFTSGDRDLISDLEFLSRISHIHAMGARHD